MGKRRGDLVVGARVLVIDDEVPIQKLLRVTLQAHGYTTYEARSGADGIVQAGMLRPDVIILDLGLPDTDGRVTLERLREWASAPIIVLTVRDDEAAKVDALDHGADDYVTKPFSMEELLARIRVALRHQRDSDDADDPVVVVGAVTVDRAHRMVLRGSDPVRLTPTEYDLLSVMVANRGRVLTHRQLLQRVWGTHHYEGASHYLRVYVGHLRKKLEEDPTQPRMILTEPGVGYRLVDPADGLSPPAP